MANRSTIQRRLVLNAVNSLANHPTADEVYNFIFSTHPSVSKGTIYRNLNSLAENGELLRVSVPNGADRFDHNNYPHYHIKCTHCGAFYDVDMPYLIDIDTKVSGITGFKLEKHEIMFEGLCTKCK